MLHPNQAPVQISPLGMSHVEPYLMRTIFWACKVCRAKHPLHPDRPEGLDPRYCVDCGAEMDAPTIQTDKAIITGLAPSVIFARVCFSVSRALMAAAKWISR